MTTRTAPQHLLFDHTPEIFASDAHGAFQHPLQLDEQVTFDTAGYDEVRFVISVWYPAQDRIIDLDRAYVEIQTRFADDDRWFKLAELEPVVPAYRPGETFDGWVVLPILGARSGWAIAGGGFSPRSRIQVRASAFFVR